MIISKYLFDNSSLSVQVYSLASSYTQTLSNNFNVVNINTVKYGASSVINKNLYIELTKEKNYVLPVSS